ncbi:DUF1671-domain-containing protein [Ramaria rubella]|nr:DUF1671-domain-containing protein [Ramaria rubella]
MKDILTSRALHKVNFNILNVIMRVIYRLIAPGSSSSRSFANSVESHADKSRASASKEQVPPLKENVFWYPAQSSVPPGNFTPGLIPTLRHALIKTHAKGATTRAMLCHEGATHVATELWDMGWGCGVCIASYRNFLMACAALATQSIQPLYFPLLDEPIPPGVRNLQCWIEDAWADGFDREGADQLRHKLVGSKKWIGTGELYVAFVSRGIPAQLVDFPGSERGPHAVTEWVMNYFSPTVPNNRPTNAFNALRGASPVICTERMPLILQHAGHSRTIVGIEVNTKGEPNLLVFDPSIRPSKELRLAGLANYSPALSASESNNTVGMPSILNRVLHPHRSKANTKRQASSTLADRDAKRVRGGLEEESLEEPLDAAKMVNFFRVTLNKLGKNDRYQILYFPLDIPLGDKERWSRRVVTSERVV